MTTTPTTKYELAGGGLFATTNNCRCHDPQLNLLRELIAAGVDQWTASLIAFGGFTPSWEAPPEVWKAWRSATIWRMVQPVRRALGLPPTPPLNRSDLR